MGGFVLVGGAGFIGAHLARRLLDAGERVVVLDAGVDYRRSSPGATAALLAWRRRVLLHGAEIVAGDARDPAALEAALRAAGPRHVVHLGNLPLADVAAADPLAARAGIVGATTNVLRAVAALPRRPTLTYVSSSMVYGDFACDPMGESGPLRPRSAYGRLKLDAERRLRAGARRAGVTVTIVRPSAVYGPGDVNGRILQRLVDAAVFERPFVLTAAPATRIDFTWVQDAAAGIHAAALRGDGPPRAYNVTAGSAQTIAAAIEIVRDRVPGLDVVLGCEDALAPRRGSLDIARARRELGWTPSRTLESGLDAYLHFVRRVVAVRAAA